MNAGEDGETKEPEPQEEEHLHHSLIDEEFLKEKKGDLFIDNVERENTETVELLLSSSSAHRVEGAAMQQIYHTLKVSGDNQSLLCYIPGDRGENSAHWVWQVAPCHLVVAQVLDHLTPVPVITISLFVDLIFFCLLTS